MKAHKVFLLLGSNLGDRVAFLETARSEISRRVGSITKRSSLYETASWGNNSLPAFLNQVVCIETGLAAREVLTEALAIERDMGRMREEKWGSRTIDIDILFYDKQVISENDLVVPHPQLHLRRFTLLPFAEIEAGFVHPVLNQTVRMLLDNLNDPLSVMLFN
jgi:2-amino-4-hydroxy-6-hydroxymethyldihydropteridine diphosphokinase